MSGARYKTAEMPNKHEAARGWECDDSGIVDDGLGVWFWCCHCFVCIFGYELCILRGLDWFVVAIVLCLCV